MVTKVIHGSNDDRNPNTQKLSYHCIHPTNNERPDFYVPAEFEERVLAHIAKNFVAHTCGINIPLILAIQGSQGDGKSSQVREVCSSNGIFVYPISGSFLSGAHEKEAVEILAESYINANFVAKYTGCLLAILIDDFDLSVASTFGEREYTVNSQLLAGFLMNLADDPTKCGKENVNRIPIIVTGNNFTSLYDPLTRHGRMDFFTWSPTSEQKREIVERMYKSCIRKEDLKQIHKLVNEFHDEPISFFDSLKSDYLNEHIYKIIRDRGGLQLNEIENIASRIFSQSINVNTLRELAVQRQKIKRKNYIQYSDEGASNKNSY